VGGGAGGKGAGGERLSPLVEPAEGRDLLTCGPRLSRFARAATCRGPWYDHCLTRRLLLQC